MTSNLIYAVVEKVDNEVKLAVKANVAFEYPMIRKAAELAQRLPAFATNNPVRPVPGAERWRLETGFMNDYDDTTSVIPVEKTEVPLADACCDGRRLQTLSFTV